LAVAKPVRLCVPLTSPQAVRHTSAVLWPCGDDDTSVPGLVLAHGAGTDLTDTLLRAASRGLSARGFPVLTFNFAYAEAGRGRPDPAGRLERAFRDAITVARDTIGDRPIVLGGRSMGGRIGSHVAAQGEPCAGLVLLGYPLHPAGRAERLRTEHWPSLRVPTLFVQGDRDRLCPLDLLDRERTERLTGAPSRLHVVAGADHGFALPKSDARAAETILEEIVDAVAAWLDTVVRRRTPGTLAS
jgi:uncharacterized protein